MLFFYKQQSYFSQIPKLTLWILFQVLVFNLMYLVSVYPTNRTYLSLHLVTPYLNIIIIILFETYRRSGQGNVHLCPRSIGSRCRRRQNGSGNPERWLLFRWNLHPQYGNSRSVSFISYSDNVFWVLEYIPKNHLFATVLVWKKSKRHFKRVIFTIVKIETRDSNFCVDSYFTLWGSMRRKEITGSVTPIFCCDVNVQKWNDSL